MTDQQQQDPDPTAEQVAQAAIDLGAIMSAIHGPVLTVIRAVVTALRQTGWTIEPPGQTEAALGARALNLWLDHLESYGYVRVTTEGAEYPREVRVEFRPDRVSLVTGEVLLGMDDVRHLINAAGLAPSRHQDTRDQESLTQETSP